MPQTSTPKNAKSKIKRKTKSNVSGRQRGILAWERDNNKGLFDTQNVVFGGEGWPPSFRALVGEMREFLFNETGLQQNWDVEDANMLRKYFYQKYKIPVKNTSVLTLHVKLATMSPRCYEQAQKVMDLYQAGKLDRARHNDTIVLAIHSTYFDFLYTYNVMEQEDEVHTLLHNICVEGRRPERRQNSRRKDCKEKKQKDETTLLEDFKKATNALKRVKEELAATEKEKKELEKEITELQKELLKVKDDNAYLASSLATESRRLDNVRKAVVALQKENEPLRKSQSNEARPTNSAYRKQQMSNGNENLIAAISVLKTSHKRKSSEIIQMRKQQKYTSNIDGDAEVPQTLTNTEIVHVDGH